MKFIVIGLGNFGSALAIRLTAMGQEVIGIDGNREKTEIFKDVITQTICLDSTNESALLTLPLNECDYAVVAIGEDFGASIMTTALLKKAGVRNLISRAINPIHHKVIETLGVDRVLEPESDSASRFADSVLYSGLNNSYAIAEDFKVIEVAMPGRYSGLSIAEIDFMNRYALMVLTVIRTEESRSIFGHVQENHRALGFPSSEMKLQKGDRLVLFGKVSDIKKLLQSPEA